MLLAVVATGAGWLARPLAMGDEPQMKGQLPAPATRRPRRTPSNDRQSRPG